MGELCLIYVSATLTSKEEESYFNLLSKYKNLYTWNYKEMLGLDPKVVIHHLSIKKGVSLKKQHNGVFTPINIEHQKGGKPTY